MFEHKISLSIKSFLLLMTAFTGIKASAEIEVIADYHFGKAGNVTYAQAPEELSPLTGNLKIKSVGKPLFFADAPDEKRLKGEGSVLFNGKTDGYLAAQSIGSPRDNFLFEVWVKPRTARTEGLRTVAMTGSGKQGYLIGQRGEEWLLVSGGVAITVLGKVTPDSWTHIALSADGDNCAYWINGQKKGRFSRTHAYEPVFAIGTSGTENTFFHGDIYEVRYATFKDGKLDVEKDMLFDFKEMKKINERLMQERKQLISTLEQDGYQRRVTDRLEELQTDADWLIEAVKTPSLFEIEKSNGTNKLKMRLSNGLVSRTFYFSDNLACVSYKNLSNDAEYLRAVKPEARLMIDNVWYDIGGLKGQKEQSYLLESWYGDLEADPNAFRLIGIKTEPTAKRYEWKPKYNSVMTPWPAKGVRAVMSYAPTESMTKVQDIKVDIIYEIYDGIPVIAKSLEIKVTGDKEHRIQQTECEVLAINQDQVKRIHTESDFSFALVNNAMQGSGLIHYQNAPKPYHAGMSTTDWRVDPAYHTWATHNQAEDRLLGYQHHNLLVSRLPMGPDATVSAKDPFRSFITFELLQDQDDRERSSLGVRRMYKVLAPQTTESLLAAGITSNNEKQIKGFLDQMAELKMERLDIMAWAGIKHDKLDSDYIKLWQNITGYARERGIVVGGYELQIASRGRGKAFDCVDPVTGKQGSLFGQSVCIASEWKDIYFTKMWKFFDQTGLMTYNMDGPYHGDPCASKEHPHHKGLDDSQWAQWKTQVEVLAELQRRNMYVPIPDWYFLNGQSATGMGYREASANLTPEQQMLLGRQYIYDGTWFKIPTMGWMTLQLVGFYTNDPRVGLEPLCQNLNRYETQLVQYLASGCQLTIRGNRLYDTPETKTMVEKHLNWFRQYRTILTSDMIHVSRPNGRDLDMMMHVNPWNKEKAMLTVFNPTDKPISKTVKVPLYYSGLKDKASVRYEEGESKIYSLDHKQTLQLPVTVPAGKWQWFVVE